MARRWRTTNGRTWDTPERIAAVRRALAQRKRRLERSLAFMASRPPRRSNAAREAQLRAEVAEFERLLAQLLAGEEPPPSGRFGQRTGALPDVLGGPEPGDQAEGDPHAAS